MRYVKIIAQETVSDDRLRRAKARSVAIASDHTSIHQEVHTRVTDGDNSQRCSSSSRTISRTITNR